MRVVADSHILIFYLFVPDRLSDRALEALGEAEDDGGIVVSAATLGDLWYASHKTGPKSLAPGAFESLRRTVLDPATNFDVVPVTADTIEHFGRVPLAELPDPFDRFILATAEQLGLPLVTADRAMSKAAAVPVVWSPPSTVWDGSSGRVARSGDKTLTCEDGTPRGNRTPNPLIKSQLLCRLS